MGFITSGCHVQCDELSKDESARRAEGGASHVVRLRRPKDPHLREGWKDLTYGTVPPPKKPEAGTEADVVLMKSDGTPTYHMANVVDDHDMKITHVIRGTEWMASTPIHIDLYNAFGWTPPQFAHVGLLTNPAGEKLSKRRSDTNIATLLDHDAVLPETLVNFLALLGWSHQEKSDVMTLSKLTRTFDLKFTRGNAIVTTEKMWYLQRHHAARRIANAKQGISIPSFMELVDRIVPVVERSFERSEYDRAIRNGDLRAYVASILMADDKSYEQPESWVERNRYFFRYDSAEVAIDQQIDVPAEDVTQLVRKIFESSIERHQIDLQTAESKPHKAWGQMEDVSQALTVSIRDACEGQAKEDKASSTEEGFKARTKLWSKAVNVFFRGRLAYGLPGPHVAQVIAILGHQECSRRLGL